MERETLIFYINAIHEGGAERVILQLAKHFAEIGYHSVLVTSFIDKNEYPVPENVERISIENEQKRTSRIKKNISRIIALRKIIKKEKAKAVISFMAEPNFRAVIATRGLSTKVITSVRNDPNREYSGMLGGFIGKWILPLADGCVFQTKDAQSWFRSPFQEKSTIIFNDVDPVFFATEWKGGNNIITLGRLCKQKNQEILISAFSKIMNKYPDVNLEIYGTGPLMETLKKQISNLKAQNRVKLMGLTNDASLVFQSAKIFVLPSDYEGMPNALLEALAIGVPSISTDCPCGGPRTVIENMGNGVLVPVQDEEKMMEALDMLLNDYEFAIKLGTEARKRALEYRTDKVFLQWKGYVQKIIGQ